MEKRLFIRKTPESIGACSSCFARNYTPSFAGISGRLVDDLYEVQIGSMVMTLCADCAHTFASMIQTEIPEDETARPPPKRN